MSSLETSVTLDDVFTVVEARRVPLAPELAGYLALEIADGTDAGSGEVDPKTVFISEEGTVALVRPKRDAIAGDAEASVRALLSKLLDASGSGTPALTSAAKRRPGDGLPALVAELEAALIPVNRAAGRRALARLVREVKRVLLGVGRNASVAPQAKPAPVAPHARPLLRKRDSDPKFTPPRDARPAAPVVRRGSPFEDEPATAKRAAVNDLGAPEPRYEDLETLVRADLRPETPRPAPAAGVLPKPIPAPAFREPIPDPGRLNNDEVDDLLGSFAVSNAHGDKQMARELKAIAGLSPTPPPPDARTIAELTKDIGKDLPKHLDSSHDATHDDSVEALLALADASAPLPGPAAPAAPPPFVAPPPAAPLAPAPIAPPPAPIAPPPAPIAPPPAPIAPLAGPAPRTAAATPAPRARATTTRNEPPRAPKTGFGLLVFALLVLAGATVATWKFAPQVFTGKKPVAPTEPAPSATLAPAPKCKVALVLTEVPTGAEILLRVGQAPVDVERMPVGTRLEFVATAEGYAPRRAVVKADLPWDKGPDGKPRIEVPIQLDPSKGKPGAVDPWPPAEPGSQVGGSGAPGTVHVVSNVRGAEVWLLAGLGPEARIEQLRCDADIDVLFAGLPNLRRRVHVSDKDIAGTAADASGNKVVSVSAKDAAK